MSIIDLTKRTTDNWDEYNQMISSSNSMVFFNNKLLLDNDCPASLLLTVGDTYIKKGIPTKIPSSGIKVAPYKTVIIEAKQQIAVPYNVFGVVTGVGINIFNSGFVSSGKIDSGYNGKLKIAYYNGNEKSVIFQEDDLLACCTFWDTEYSMHYQLQNYHSSLRASIEETSYFFKWIEWLKENWYSILALIISIIAIIVGVR